MTYVIARAPVAVTVMPARADWPSAYHVLPRQGSVFAHGAAHADTDLLSNVIADAAKKAVPAHRTAISSI
jgi:hypothetical protein